MNCRPILSRPTLLLAAAAVLAISSKSPAQDDYWDPGYDSGGSHGGGGGVLHDSEFSYGYFDFGYVRHNFDRDVLGNANGFGGKLSIPLVDSLFIGGALNYASSSTLDYIDWDVGIGMGFSILRNLDLVLEGGLARQKLDSAAFDRPGDGIDGYGYFISPSLRLALGEYVELNGGVTYRNVDSHNGFDIDLKALLLLTSNVSLWGGVTFSEEVNQYGVGLRLGF